MPRREPAAAYERFAEHPHLKPPAGGMRPATLDEIIGQQRLLGAGTPLLLGILTAILEPSPMATPAQFPQPPRRPATPPAASP